VERDRDVARETAVAGVLEQLLPVLDDVHLARQHGDLEGTPFAAIADKLESVLGRFGLARFGEAGEAFDPAVHEALIHTEADLPEGTEGTTVVQVLQPGYRAGDRVLRAARVAVADPS
jgi:molecular chaperone GrpE